MRKLRIFSNVLLAVVIIMVTVSVQQVFAAEVSPGGIDGMVERKTSDTQEQETVLYLDENARGAENNGGLQVNKEYSVKEIWGEGASSYSQTIEFVIPSPGRVRFLFQNCVNPQYYIDSQLQYNENYKAAFVLSNDLESASTNWLALYAGNYQICFRTGSTINAEAAFMIQYEPEGTYAGEVEGNDSFDTANKILPNICYQGAANYRENYSTRGDQDYFYFTISKPSKVKISVLNPKNNQPFEGQIFSLYKEYENGNTERLTRQKYADGKSIFSEMRLPAGNYYILVNPYIGQSYSLLSISEYNLCVKITEESSEFYEQENNDLMSRANVKEVNHWYTGNINFYMLSDYNFTTEYDIDWYQFYIPKKSYLAMELRVPRQMKESVTATLYMPDGKILSEIESTENPYLKAEENLVEAGTYYIRMTAEERMDWDYSICLSQRDYIPVEKISLPTAKSMELGQTAVLKASITPANASEQELLWSSSNNKVAEVDSQGRVTGKAIGSATITATAKIDGSKKATCRVRVYEKGKVPINSDNPILSHKKASLTIGKALQLKLKGASGKIQWSSQSPSIAEVSATGKVRGKKVGKASVVASYKGKEYRCVLTILPTKQKITYAKSLKPGQVMLKWKRDKSAKGYQIQYSTDRKFKKNVKSVRVDYFTPRDPERNFVPLH